MYWNTQVSECMCERRKKKVSTEGTVKMSDLYS